MDEVGDRPRAGLTVAAEPDGRLRVRLGGEPDIAGLPDIRATLDALLAREPWPLLIDLEPPEFLDSSGVAVLIRIANHFTPVETRAPVPAVHRVLEALGLAGRFGLNGT